jgi:RNA polymerase sigma factor (sigma-70 family)
MATGPLAPVVNYLRKVTSSAALAELPDADLLARFAQQRDEAAFTVLVRRHGAMVLAVCRRVVRDGHAAEDAFQATFLVLARKAGSLSHPELLGHWLYGVAYRTAMKARREAAKRRAHETQAVRVQEGRPSEEIHRQDLRAVLDEEVNRLPERYRVPVVLCYLQGQTNAEAARRLGCSRGTIATLLARARDKLRRRLTQRGITLGVLTPTLRGEAVPLALQNVTVKAAALLSAGQMQAVGALATQAVALAKGVSKAMLFEKLRIPVAILLVIALVGTGAGVGVYCTGAPASEVAESAQEAKPGPQNKAERQKQLADKPSDESLRKPPPAPVAKHNFRGELPTKVAPFIQILVMLGEDGQLTVCQNGVSFRAVSEVATLKDGRKYPISYFEEESRYVVDILPIDQVRVYDTKGRKIDAKELRKRLKGETLALASTDGCTPDPLHLRLYKENTLVFVGPVLQAQGVGAPPLVGHPQLPLPVEPVPPAAVPAPLPVTPSQRSTDPKEKAPPSGS